MTKKKIIRVILFTTANLLRKLKFKKTAIILFTAHKTRILMPKNGILPQFDQNKDKNKLVEAYILKPYKPCMKMRSTMKLCQRKR